MRPMAQQLLLKLTRTRANEDLPLPSYQSEQASGLDLYADLDADLTLAPLERAAVPTGIALELPSGFEGQVRPRSGLALKQGITCLNTPGTIDADYRGEVKVILINLSNQPVHLRRGDRIAQLVICPVVHAQVELSASLGQTSRGSGGFGSTGR